MNRPFILAVMATAASLPAFAQGLAPSLNQPIGESELLRSVEQLGTTTARASRPATQLAQATTPAADDEKPRKEGNGTTEITAKEAAFDQNESTRDRIRALDARRTQQRFQRLTASALAAQARVR